VLVASNLLKQLHDFGVLELHSPDPVALTKFIDKGMRHEISPERSLREYLSPAQLSLWTSIEATSVVESADSFQVTEAAMRALSDFSRVDARLESAQLLEQELNSLEAHHAQELDEYIQQIQLLESWIRQLLSELESVFVSFRWRIGSIIARGTDHLAFRGRRDTVHENIQQITAQFRSWRVTASSQYNLEPIELPDDAPAGSEIAQESILTLIRIMLRHPGKATRMLSPERAWNFLITCFKQPAHIRHEIFRNYVTIFRSENETDEEIYKWLSRPPAIPIVFPQVSKPDVSVIVPVFNKLDTTLACLAALRDNSAGVEYEVIVADDASTDETKHIDRYCENIRIVRSNKNLGFVQNCNSAVAESVGRFVFLLNNDAFVKKACLSLLLETAQRDNSIGVVGPKIIYPDGRLQEAGGIVWRDGSAWNYGRGDDPSRPEYNYVKEVDYISGAAILCKRDLWESIGGFDVRFAPAYYEDTDLAFRVRQQGQRVIYQPKAVVIHAEGASHGTDQRTGIKEYQAINQSKFFQKWRDELERTHYANAKCVFRARERSRDRPIVLVVDHHVPEYDKDAGSRSTLQYLQLLVRNHAHVKFLPDNFHRSEPYTSTLEQLGIEVLYGDWYARNWKQWWRENGRYFNVVYLHRPNIAHRYMDTIRREENVKVIYFGHDLHYLRVERQSEVEQNPALKRDAKKWRNLEFSIIEKSDVVYFPSVVEVDKVRKRFPKKCVRAIPLYITKCVAEPVTEFAKRTKMIFVGGFRHPPNVDGINWFVKEVLPLVIADLPAAKFVIAGSRMPDEILNLANDHVLVKGSVSERELTDLYAQARVIVVPVRFGAGIKGKVLEGLQYRVPVVTTSIGAEGLPGPLDYLEVADNADDFARGVIDVYTDGVKWRLLSDRGAEIISRHFSDKRAMEVVGEDFGL
jgi:GT2 family glycosyltransferase